MDDEPRTPILERLKDATAELNAAASAAHATMTEVEEYLAPLGLGVAVEVPVDVGPHSDPGAVYLLRYGRYGQHRRFGSNFRLLIVAEKDDDRVETPPGSAKRALKIAALAALPALIDAIRAEILRLSAATDTTVGRVRAALIVPVPE